MPKISVVLPTYNGEKYIKESIDSILSQTFTDWELVIVDNCSTDNTYKIAKDYEEKDCRIRVIHNNVNKGLPNSLNIGFRETVGEYLTWTSDDNLYMPDAFGKMSEYLDINRDVIMVQADTLVIDENSAILKEYLHFQPDEIYVHDVVGPCFLYRREVLKTVGEYNPELYCIEDYDYWLRIYKTYGKIGHIPEKMYLYRQHGMSLTAQKREFIVSQRTKMREQYLSYIFTNLSGKNKFLTEIYYEMLWSGFPKERFPEEVKSEVAPMLNGDVLNPLKGRLISYGAGEYGDRAYQLVGSRIAYYIDQDPLKQGTQKNGISVISMQDMINKNLNYTILISVAPRNIYDVLNVLRQYGIKKFCTFARLEHYLKANEVLE